MKAMRSARDVVACWMPAILPNVNAPMVALASIITDDLRVQFVFCADELAALSTAGSGVVIERELIMSRYFAGFCVAMFWCVSARAQDGDELKNRFMSEGPQGWRQYGDFASRLQGSARSKMIDAEGNTYYAHFDKIKQNANCKLAVRQFSGADGARQGKGEGFVWGYNTLYAFHLTRKTETAEWVIADLRIKDGEADLKSIVAKASSACRGVADLISVGTHTTLQQLIERPGFRIKSAKKIVHLNSDAVSIEFENPHSLDQKPFDPIQGGVLILDPNHCWCLRRYETSTLYEGSEGGTRVGETTYRLSKSNIPIPVQIKEKSESSEQGKIFVDMRQSDYELHEPERLPSDEEFTVSAFGFPEPPGMPSSGGTSWFAWLTGAGILCLATAAVVWRYKSRRA
jgi:hypothetical protein